MSINSYTSNWRFGLINFNSANWHSDEWENWKLVDALISQQFSEAIPFAVASGTGDAITLDFSTDVVIAPGLMIGFKITANNTGAVTISCDGGAAKNLLVLGAAAQAGDLRNGAYARAVYDGTQFVLIEPIYRFNSVTVIEGAGNASVVTADCDSVVVKSDTNAGISILTPNNAVGKLAFGDVDDSDVAYIKYNHATATMEFSAEGVFKFSGVPIQLTLTGATPLSLREYSANLVLLGDYSAAKGVFIDMTNQRVGIHTNAPLASFHVNGDARIAGNLVVTGNLTGASMSAALITSGTLPLARGGTGGTDAATARTSLGLGSLATLNTVNGSNWSGADLALADGGTGASTADAAFNNIAASGGTVGGAIVRSTKGAYPCHNSTSVTDPKIYMQAAGADPTANPGDIVYEW